MSMLCWRVFGESWVGRLRWDAWHFSERLKHELPSWPDHRVVDCGDGTLSVVRR